MTTKRLHSNTTKPTCTSVRRASLATATLALLVLVTGCETTGLSPRENNRASYSHFVYQMAREQPQTTTTRPLRKPIRLAVAQVGEVAPSTNVLNRLRNHPEQIASVIALPLPGATPNSTYQHWSPERSASQESPVARAAEIRSLARAMGADSVLIFGGSIDARSSRNLLAVLDATLVGTAIFPSTEIHAEGKAAGLLLDVDSGAIRFQVEAEQATSGKTPSAFTHEKSDAVRVKVRDALAANLTEEFINRLRRE